ncbi:MAG: ABC transporter permease [Lentimicrobiaceae bacterium]|jgi:putative ABC transport system permease protein
MNITNLFRISVKALGSNKFRALLTMLGIIIGVAAVIAMLAIGQGSKQSIQDQISQMGSNMLMIQPGANMFQGARLSASATQTLVLADYNAIKTQCPDLSAVSPMVNANGQSINGANNWPVNMQGVNEEYLQIRKFEIKSGRMFTEREIASAAKVCLLGKTVVDNLFTDGSDPVGKSIRYNKIPFQVIGVLAEKGTNSMGQDQDNVLLAPYTTVQKRIMAITYLNGIYCSTTTPEVSQKAKAEVETILRTQHHLNPNGSQDDFNVRSQDEILSMFSSTSTILTILLAVIAGISLVVGGIGIMNIMFVSVTERTREIGLRMAVGARGLDIMTQFLTEAILISVLGGLIGVALGIGSSFLIRNFLHWPIIITSYSIILSFAVCTFTGVFFGWYPAKKAANLDPIDAIRYE